MKKVIILAFISLLMLSFCVSCSCSREGLPSENGGGSVNNSTPHDHAWDKGRIVVPATEEQPGKMSYTCVICNEVREEPIPKAPHQHLYTGIWATDRANHWHVCLINNCTIKGDKGAHVWDEGEIIKEANQTTTGVKKFTCTVCHYAKEEEYRARAEVTKEEFVNALSEASFENVTIKLTFEGNTTIIKCAGGKTQITGVIMELNFDKLEYESFTYDKNTRVYLYDTGTKKYACQFADGRLSVFSSSSDGSLIKMEFSSYGTTVIE